MYLDKLFTATVLNYVSLYTKYQIFNCYGRYGSRQVETDNPFRKAMTMVGFGFMTVFYILFVFFTLFYWHSCLLIPLTIDLFVDYDIYQ